MAIEKGGPASTSLYTEEQKDFFKEQILEMYASRATFMSMAREIGVNVETVRRWLDEAIQEIREPDPAKERQKDLILVDRSIRALIPDVLAGKTSAHMALNRWLERRARYLGLDEPEKLDLGGSFNGTIEDEVKDLLTKLGINMDND